MWRSVASFAKYLYSEVPKLASKTFEAISDAAGVLGKPDARAEEYQAIQDGIDESQTSFAKATWDELQNQTDLTRDELLKQADVEDSWTPDEVFTRVSKSLLYVAGAIAVAAGAYRVDLAPDLSKSWGSGSLGLSDQFRLDDPPTSLLQVPHAERDFSIRSVPDSMPVTANAEMPTRIVEMPLNAARETPRATQVLTVPAPIRPLPRSPAAFQVLAQPVRRKTFLDSGRQSRTATSSESREDLHQGGKDAETPQPAVEHHQSKIETHVSIDIHFDNGSTSSDQVKGTISTRKK